jgi:hypothetical protein
MTILWGISRVIPEEAKKMFYKGFINAKNDSDLLMSFGFLTNSILNNKAISNEEKFELIMYCKDLCDMFRDAIKVQF